MEITRKAGDESHSTRLESLPSQVAPLPQGMALCIQGPDPKMGALVLGNLGKGIPAPLEVPSGTTRAWSSLLLESQCSVVPGSSAAECWVPGHARTCSAGVGCGAGLPVTIV